MGLRKRDKQSKDLPPPPGLPAMPAPPAPGMPMPPAPNMSVPPSPGLPLPPNPPLPSPPIPAVPVQPTTVPPVPAQPPTPTLTQNLSALPPQDLTNVTKPSSTEQKPVAIEALPPSQVPVPETVEEETTTYSGLYAKKSGKPLQQVYGHIDRIGEGEIGSLLDRYSDRFGHELDRDIIVMRKEERDDKIAVIRDSPTVELLNEEVEEESHLDGETLVELNTQLKTVEDELRRLKPEYQAAKDSGDRELLRELRPSLEQLMTERKLIKSVIAGEADLDELLAAEDDEDYDEEEEYDEEEYDEEEYDDEDETYHQDEESDSDDLFPQFVSIIDSFLGELPEDQVVSFTKSPGFEIYKVVASDPDGADSEDRSEFFSVVDTLLGSMPDEAIIEFTESDDFEVYRAVGAVYS